MSNTTYSIEEMKTRRKATRAKVARHNRAQKAAMLREVLEAKAKAARAKRDELFQQFKQAQLAVNELNNELIEHDDLAFVVSEVERAAYWKLEYVTSDMKERCQKYNRRVEDLEDSFEILAEA